MMGTPCSFLPGDCSVSENVNILIASSPSVLRPLHSVKVEPGDYKNWDPALPGVSLGSGSSYFLVSYNMKQ